MSEKDIINKQTTAGLTKDELWEIEENNKSRHQKILDFIISFFPIVCFAIAVLEYILVPDKYPNANPKRYLILLSLPIAVYVCRLIHAILLYKKGNRKKFAKVRFKAPFLSAIFLFLALFDVLTLKTGILLYPFIPWVNDIINAAILDKDQLIVCTLFTLRLLFTGYICGVVLGIITGVASGYSEKVRYWISPIVKVLGPIPTATWIPLIMILASSLMAGSVFIVGLGTWFAVTIATTSGISNVDKSYYEVAKTLGSSNRQHAQYFTGNDTGNELSLYFTYDSRDAWCRGGTWLVHNLGKGLGSLQQDVCGNSNYLYSIQYSNKSTG